MPTSARVPETAHHNHVVLRGRFAARDEPKELPSGDVVVGFRLVVERPPMRVPDGRATVDTIDCQATRRAVHRTIARLSTGDVVEAEGALRRRFWRGPAGPASRYSVEVARLRPVRASSSPP